MAQIDASNKAAGLLVPVFALRRNGDLGIGDTLCVEEAIDFLARHNLSVLQLLPVNETGGDNSPYGAISSIALDPLYISRCCFLTAVDQLSSCLPFRPFLTKQTLHITARNLLS